MELRRAGLRLTGVQFERSRGDGAMFEKNRVAMLVLAFVALAGVAVACAQGEGQSASEPEASEQAASPTPSPTPFFRERRVVPALGFRPGWPLSISGYDVVVEGRVSESRLVSPTPVPVDPAPTETPVASPGPTLPPWHPKAQITPDPNFTPEPYQPPPYTVHRVEVLQVFRAEGIHPGDVIEVRQDGGLVDDILWEMEGEPLMQVGSTYLLFLVQRDGEWRGPGAGKLLLDECGTLQPIYSPEFKQIIDALPGRYLEDVAAEIRAVDPTRLSRSDYDTPYDTIESLVAWHDTIVVGKVASVTVNRWDGIGQPDMWDETYTVEVIDGLRPPALKPGDAVTVYMQRSEEYPLLPMDVGQTYLLFLQGQISMPYVRYTVDECGRLKAVEKPEPRNDFEALWGLTVDQAAAKIAEALAKPPMFER